MDSNNLQRNLSIDHLIELRERMASIEANNEHTRQALQDISISLKEVVKTQNILANQKETITELAKHYTNLQRELREATESNTKQTYQIESLTRKSENLRSEVDTIEQDVVRNKHYLTLVTRIGTLILVPIALGLIKAIFGFPF